MVRSTLLASHALEFIFTTRACIQDTNHPREYAQAFSLSVERGKSKHIRSFTLEEMARESRCITNSCRSRMWISFIPN